MPNPDYSPLYAPLGAKYPESKIVSHSHYRDPIDPRQTVSGRSHVWGDATPQTQRATIDALMAAGNRAGLSDRSMAHVLAIARHESGFNPHAAAGSTSASGLGQFVDDTGAAYGISAHNRWDVNAQARALVAHFLDNQERAKSRGQADEAYIYKYHHDGPSRNYGGLEIARRDVVPWIDAMQAFVREHRAQNRSTETPITAAPFGEVTPQGVPGGMKSAVEEFEHQLGERLSAMGFENAQIETLASAAAKEATRHEAQGHVERFLLSLDGGTICLQQQFPPLREFSVAQALARSEQQHWGEAVPQHQDTSAALRTENSPQGLAAPGFAQGAPVYRARA